MKSVKKYSPETRGRAVRLVFEQERGHSSQWGARQWEMPGPTTDEREPVKELERENRELKRANEILRKASAYFAQAELDRRPR
jgi:transposase